MLPIFDFIISLESNVLSPSYMKMWFSQQYGLSVHSSVNINAANDDKSVELYLLGVLFLKAVEMQHCF